ncbi:MAG: ABC transporter permease [Jatrophihabitans sp.]|nr:MAG: ABC transporter permease [Jatrophihabitans sp.]
MADTAILTPAPASRPPATTKVKGLPRVRVGGRAGWTVIAMIVLIAVWAAAVALFSPKSYILPSPWTVGKRLWTSREQLIRNGGPTIKEILEGYVIGVLIAVPLGMVIVASKWLNRLLYPLLIAFNSIPKVALAPLFVVWWGYGETPRIVITFSIAFFPVLVNTVTGLGGVDPEMVRLARSMGAPKRRVFVRVRLPQALPSIFAGMKVATSLAVIGGIIGEFVASDKGWGYLLIQAQGQLDTSLIFAIIVLLAVFATILYYVVEFIERLTIPWHSSQRQN